MTMNVDSTPLTFDLPQSLSDKIERARTKLGLKTVSAVVRLALERFNIASFKPVREPRRQISVRLAPKTRVAITHAAKRKQVSAGEILRSALDTLTQSSKHASRAAKTSKKKKR